MDAETISTYKEYQAAIGHPSPVRSGMYYKNRFAQEGVSTTIRQIKARETTFATSSTSPTTAGFIESFLNTVESLAKHQQKHAHNRKKFILS